MNLPHYFLADLPPGAPLTPVILTEACETLRRNRATYLAQRRTASVISVLSEAGADWLKRDYPLRSLALAEGERALGFSRQTLEAGLDAFFRQLTRENLELLLEQDLGHVSRLDQWVATEAEVKGGRAGRAIAPEFLFQIAAGNLPVSALHGMVLGVLMRSAQMTKCATGKSLIPRLFAHSLYQAQPKLGACIEVVEWPGGNQGLEEVALRSADCVTASGTDVTLESIRQRVPGTTRFLGYGHRVSFGYVAAEMLSSHRLRDAITRAGADVVAWDQLGCLSPHVIYVENGGLTPPESFAELLAEELERRERAQPRGPLAVADAAAISSRRDFYELRAAHSRATRIWRSRDSTAWTVVFEATPLFQLSCLHRFIYVKSVRDLEEALREADAVREKVSTVGLAAPDPKRAEMTEMLARWGVSRVCPLGRMQEPPLAWRHDGRPSLGDFVRWVDSEAEEQSL